MLLCEKHVTRRPEVLKSAFKIEVFKKLLAQSWLKINTLESDKYYTEKVKLFRKHSI